MRTHSNRGKRHRGYWVSLAGEVRISQGKRLSANQLARFETLCLARTSRSIFALFLFLFFDNYFWKIPDAITPGKLKHKIARNHCILLYFKFAIREICRNLFVVRSWQRSSLAFTVCECHRKLTHEFINHFLQILQELPKKCILTLLSDAFNWEFGQGQITCDYNTTEIKVKIPGILKVFDVFTLIFRAV